MEVTREVVLELVALAKQSRDRAYTFGKTKVGAAVLSSDGGRFAGCNVEHRYRCHDVHAEINAISTMVAAGQTSLVAVAIVSDRPNLSPCGGCLDWILQFGGPSCVVVWQSTFEDQLSIKSAGELMPHHPPYE